MNFLLSFINHIILINFQYFSYVSHVLPELFTHGSFI